MPKTYEQQLEIIDNFIIKLKQYNDIFLDDNKDNNIVKDFVNDLIDKIQDVIYKHKTHKEIYHLRHRVTKLKERINTFICNEDCI